MLFERFWLGIGLRLASDALILVDFRGSVVAEPSFAMVELESICNFPAPNGPDTP
jgi:hypothetical protein